MTTGHAGYLPDLSAIDLDSFGTELKTGRLLPSRQPLLEEIDARFAALAEAGIRNLADLKEGLGSAGRLVALARATGIPESYLKLLKREANSLLPKPFALRDVPNMPDEIIDALDNIGLADTQALFPRIRDAANRAALAAETNLDAEQVLWLAKLVDLSRIKWTGPKLTRLILDTDYDTVAKLAMADPHEALAAFKRAKAEHKAYDGPLGINDIESWIRQVVSKTPLVIAY